MAKAEAARVLEIIVAGEGAHDNAKQQLLTLHRSDPRLVLQALSEKVNAVVANADSGAFSAQAAALLVNAATFLDQQSANGFTVGKALLEHVLVLTGGPGRAAKDASVRSQGCVFVAALAGSAPTNAEAEVKLIEFSQDRVPSIRERAIRGLGALQKTLANEQALIARTTDPVETVRSAATGSLKISPFTAPAMLKRIDDVEAIVRSQLFHTLRVQPQAIQEFGPAALARLCAGLVDRSAPVRQAAGLAVDAWREQVGSALALLSRCDITGDEAIANAAASALAIRFPDESRTAARDLFASTELQPAQRRRSNKGASAASLAFERGGLEGYGALLFARHALASMSEDKRDEIVDVPLCLRRCLDALEKVSRPHGPAYLKQLLHVVALVDFCEDAMRACAEKLAEAILSKAPIEASEAQGADDFGLMDLGVVLLRKCCGLLGATQFRPAKQQALESQCSTRVVLIVSDLCQPLQGDSNGSDDAFSDGNFALRLSVRLQDVNNKIEIRTARRTELAQQKKKAVANEEFIVAEKLKQAAKKNDEELALLQKDHRNVKDQRDCSLLRVLAILKALLRWSNSDVRRDPALKGILDQILRPVVSLPALTPDVELAAVTCICLLCVRDPMTAKGHWGLLMELLRMLRMGGDVTATEKKNHQARAVVAARTLVDCSLVHHSHGEMDRDEVLSAAHALAAVPFASRRVAIDPMMRWLTAFGHIFFEEHLREPVLEVQWALGWMLVEAFKQEIQEDEEEPEAPSPKKPAAKARTRALARGNSWVSKPMTAIAAPEPEEQEDGDDKDDDSEANAVASKVLRFFNLLPKMPGKHSAPMLSLALESVAESGLWRRAVLLQRMVGGTERWVRGFSWPQLFAFTYERLSEKMHFRLWKCSLQLCIASPKNSLLAEVHLALIRHLKVAPPGAGALVREAVSKGADQFALAPLLEKLPGAQGAMPEDAREMLLNREDALEQERERRISLAQLGVHVEAWAPADLPESDFLPPHHRMRGAKGKDLKGEKKAKSTIVPQPMSLGEEYDQQVQEQQPNKRRRVVGKTQTVQSA